MIEFDHTNTYAPVFLLRLGLSDSADSDKQIEREERIKVFRTASRSVRLVLVLHHSYWTILTDDNSSTLKVNNNFEAFKTFLNLRFGLISRFENLLS